jgi:multidrug transporter EmrE-like cation transporter
MRSFHWTKLGIAAVFGFTTLTAVPPSARADNVDGKGKGIAGGILLGAEIVTIPMALFGVKAGWAYAVFAGAGAIGGGIAGWGVESATGAYASPAGDGRAPVYMLAGGLALVIPAVVLLLNATRYQPDENAKEDQAPKNAPAADPGKAGGSPVIEGGAGGGGSISTDPKKTEPSGGGGGGTTPKPEDKKVPHSLIDVNQGNFRLGVPMPEIREAYSLKQLRDLGVRQVTEVRMPLVQVTF